MLSRRLLRGLSSTNRASRHLQSILANRQQPVRSYAVAQAPSPNDAFANGSNAYYADEMYRLWKEDPKSVHPSWDVYFSGLDKGLPSSVAFQPPPSTHLPHPADGAPNLHSNGGGDLDVHLKVRHFFTLAYLFSYSSQQRRCNFLFEPTKCGGTMWLNWTL